MESNMESNRPINARDMREQADAARSKREEARSRRFANVADTVATTQAEAAHHRLETRKKFIEIKLENSRRKVEKIKKQLDAKFGGKEINN